MTKKIEVMLTDANWKQYKALSLAGTFVRSAKQGDKFKVSQAQLDDANERKIGLSVIESDDVAKATQAAKPAPAKATQANPPTKPKQGE